MQGFQEISADCDRFIREMCNGEMGTLLDQMVTTTLVGTLAESFSSSAETLGLEREVARWKPVEEWVAGYRQRRESREFIVDGRAVKSGTMTGGIIGGSIGSVARQPDTQPPLTDADLKPMRLVNHEVLSWAFSYASWILLGLFACLAASYRFRVSAIPRRLARRMEDLLRRSDWG